MNLDEDVIRERLAVIAEEHRDLDDAIAALMLAGSVDLLLIQRMKKRKLSLKDEIGKLQNMLVPDIIA
ncbi:YdcH family protein [Kordiimonas pumila]|uniref:YdcH family protein n=1 Tax=Kordiimonas pumila TaxID=2161677 RepID=A0ABV7D6H9_9PROT|nr:DUF465 domain-containing protein [Kordiimonas pumila]